MRTGTFSQMTEVGAYTLRDIKRYWDPRYQRDETMEDRMDLLIHHSKAVMEEQRKWAEYEDTLDQKNNFYRKRIQDKGQQKMKESIWGEKKL